MYDVPILKTDETFLDFDLQRYVWLPLEFG